MLGCLSLYHRRDRRKLETLNSKMRKMVAELKVSGVWIALIAGRVGLPLSHLSAWVFCVFLLRQRRYCYSQDSTHYEKTLKLLEKYDPDYVPPTPRKQYLPRLGPGSPRPLDSQTGVCAARRMVHSTQGTVDFCDVSCVTICLVPI